MVNAVVRIGIALGSGGARGWAHIGVLAALHGAGIRPQIVCGTSCGAFVGGAFVCDRMDALESWARDLNRLRLTRLFDFHFKHGGLLAGRRMMQFYDDELKEQLIENLGSRFAAVCTDLDTGHEVLVQEGNLATAVRASSSVPGLLPPVRFDGRWLVDGALVNPIPVSACRALGAHLVIAVNLNANEFGPMTQSEELEEPDGHAIVGRMRSLPGADFVRQLFNRQSQEPSILGVMARSLDIVQARISRARLASDPPDVLIAPALGSIGMLQLDRAAEAIAAGEAAAYQSLPAIEAAMRRFPAADGRTASDKSALRGGSSAAEL
jgi:NTE family protein